MLYIIEVVYSIESKHLLVLKSAIEFLCKNLRDTGLRKNFIVLIRMYRNDISRVPLRFDIEWDVRMFENLKNNCHEILETKEKV